jgi:SAM-dependent methyltransferase
MTTIAQHWNPENYARNARFVSDLAGPVLQLLAARPGERILDLGCGDGVLAAHLASLGCSVRGVDSSPDQVAAARARGIDATCANGEELSFDGELDAVFSNAALHWMRQPDAVIAGVRRALVPGGRFVGEFGGQGSVAMVRGALRSALASRGLDERSLCPWYFPSDGEYRARLESGGFRVVEIQLLPRPTPLPGEMVSWLELFAQSYTTALPVEDRADFLTEVTEALRPVMCDELGRWTADYVRLRFSAVKR